MIHTFAALARFQCSVFGVIQLMQTHRSIHVVSQVHVFIVVPFALYCIMNENPERKFDKAFGWDSRSGYVHAIACGCVFIPCSSAPCCVMTSSYIYAWSYFLWDTLDAIFNFIDPGFVAHGVACFAIYSMSYVRIHFFGISCQTYRLIRIVETICCVLWNKMSSLGDKYLFLK